MEETDRQRQANTVKIILDASNEEYNENYSEAACIYADNLAEPARTEELNIILEYQIKQCYIRTGIKTAKLLSKTLETETLLSIFNYYYNSRMFNQALEAVDNLPRPIRTKCISKILGRYVRGGYFNQAKDTVKFLGRKLTLKEIRKLVGKITKKRLYHNPSLAANLLPEPERTAVLEEIIKKHLENFTYIDYMMKTFEILGREPTQQELELILEKHLADGNLNRSQHIARKLGRKLTQDEIDRIFNICLKKRLYICDVCCGQNFARATQNNRTNKDS